MQRYMKVDVFGGCEKGCPDKFKDGRMGDCKLIIATEYKFYLAFENSICKDYVTEKLFGILKYNVIPVVLNGASNDFYVRYYCVYYYEGFESYFKSNLCKNLGNCLS
jgi:hypothetical protein